MSEANIHELEVDGKQIILIGTAHVSKHSAEEVKEVIEREKPDSVCVELCQSRYNSIYNKNNEDNKDIIKIIKDKKVTLFLVNLILSSYQKRMAKQLGVKSGQEMMQGVESAKEVDAELVLADRNIDITFKRILGNLSFWQKMKMVFGLILSVFSDEKITEEELEELKSGDMLDSALSELTKSMPKLKAPLVDERDKYLAQKIKTAPGEKVVAVLGAAHIPGIKKEIHKNNDLRELTRLPKKKKTGKIIGWSIPVIILALIIYTFIENKDAGLQQLLSWILWNGSLSAIGALIIRAHPLSILTAFVVAPISSLNPLFAAGWFAGLSEVFLRKPSVKDFENLSEDVLSFKGFWNNKVTHILLVVIFVNIGSVLGTIIGGSDIVRIFLNNI